MQHFLNVIQKMMLILENANQVNILIFIVWVKKDIRILFDKLCPIYLELHEKEKNLNELKGAIVNDIISMEKLINNCGTNEEDNRDNDDHTHNEIYNTHDNIDNSDNTIVICI